MESNYSLSDMAAMMNGNNQGMNWNSPMWLIWAMLFGNGGFGGWGNRAGAVEANDINGRFNALSQQIADNQSTNTLNTGISSNHDYLHSMQNAINMGFAGVNSAVNQASMTNALGQKDLQSAIQTCCCNNTQNILNQTNQLQSQIATLANGVQTGFANLGFLTQSQTNELSNVMNSNTQRVLDKMCSDTTQGLRDKLAEASQNAQTSYLISQLKTTA